jgi:hypothetical protein
LFSIEFFLNVDITCSVIIRLEAFFAFHIVTVRIDLFV